MRGKEGETVGMDMGMGCIGICYVTQRDRNSPWYDEVTQRPDTVPLPSGASLLQALLIIDHTVALCFIDMII